LLGRSSAVRIPRTDLLAKTVVIKALAAELAAIEDEGATGIYNVCDDKPLIQEFLDQFAVHPGCRKPWRLPEWTFYAAGASCETIA
jgi:hypothetical protein